MGVSEKDVDKNRYNLEVSGCSRVKQLQRIGTIWKTSFPGTPPIAESIHRLEKEQNKT